jgi:hypothetical protein
VVELLTSIESGGASDDTMQMANAWAEWYKTRCSRMLLDREQTLMLDLVPRPCQLRARALAVTTHAAHDSCSCHSSQTTGLSRTPRRATRCACALQGDALAP